MRHITALLSLLVARTAAAQATAISPEDPASPRVQYAAKTEIDMEGANVDGTVRAPLGARVASRRELSTVPLLELKADFDPELVASVNHVR